MKVKKDIRYNFFLKRGIVIPSSKSHTMRALLFALMAKGRSHIENALHCADTTAMITACRTLGAKIIWKEATLIVDGTGGDLQAPKEMIDAKQSGIIARFIPALGALSNHKIQMQIDQRRPKQDLLQALSKLGVQCKLNPLEVQGPMQCGEVTIDGKDSQPVSALLIACSFLPGKSTINVTNPKELPWIDLTLSWLERFGIQYEREGYEHFTLYGNAHIDGFSYVVPGDFSSAAFPAVAALITQERITLHGLDFNDAQGDKELFAVLEEMGAQFTINERELMVCGGGLHGREIDLSGMIDAICILAVIGCFAKGRTVLYNGAIARTKESNRIHAMATELRKMGASIEETEDGLIIEESTLYGTEVNGHNDHRVAMALTIAGLGAIGETKVIGKECVNKTYPTFFEIFA